MVDEHEEAETFGPLGTCSCELSRNGDRMHKTHVYSIGQNKNKNKKTPAWNWGNGQQTPNIAEELLATDCFRVRKS